MKTAVQLLDLYTDLDSHNAQRYRETDERRTDGRHDDANSQSHCVAVRSAKKVDKLFLINLG